MRIAPLHLLLIAPLLFACDPAPATTPPDSGQDAAEQERKRQEAIEKQRAEALQKLEEAKLAFEADRTLDAFEHYVHELQSVVRIDDPEVREGIDLGPHYEVLLHGVGKELLDQMLADYKNKKKRTTDLEWDLKGLYSKRIALLRWQQPGSDSYKDEGLAMLAIGPADDEWTIGYGGILIGDSDFLETLEKEYGRDAVHALCRAALDRAVADDKRDKNRRHYIMETCVPESSAWEADLAAWAKSKETKEFRKAYASYYAEAINEIAAAEAEREAKKRGDVGSDEPTVTLLNSCDSGIKLVIGSSPKAGRTVTLSVDSQTTETIEANQQVFLVGDNNKAIAHATVSRYTGELEFTCTGVIYR